MGNFWGGNRGPDFPGVKRVEVVSNDALAVQVEVEEAAVEDDVVVALEQVHHGLLHPRRNHAEVAHFDQCINLIFGSSHCQMII